MNQKTKRISIAVASLALIGSVSVGAYFGLQEDAPKPKTHQAEKKLEEQLDRRPAKQKEASRTKKDVLGNVLAKEQRYVSMVDGVSPTKETVDAKNVALKALAAIPEEVTPVTPSNPAPAVITLDQTKPVSPGLVNGEILPVQPNKPVLPVTPEEPMTPSIPTPPVEPTVPEEETDGGGGHVTPEPEHNESPTITTQDVVIHAGSPFNPYAYATAMDAEDGDLTGSIQVIGNNVNPDREGSYTVTYFVTDSKGASVKQTMTVTVVNDAPVIHASEQTLSIGDTFDPMKGVTAEDTEDGILTASIHYEGTVDTTTPGAYSVTYRVADRFGKEATAVTVTIYVVNDLPVIQAQDLTLEVGDVFDVLQGVTASDKQDGDVTASIRIQTNTVDTAVAGTYQVVYEVTDAHGGIGTKTITVVVKEKNTAPDLTVPDQISLVVGEQPDWLVGVVAMDKEDGDLSAAVEVDASHVDLSLAGDYIVTYMVTDSNGEKITKQVPVHVTNEMGQEAGNANE
ncbi:hypothetical protein EP56_01740 [Listeriaceae bacterium FSL A5-0209]|nr:hypothetical protein EP56_01740 [Listeriaceae bacterium FSL A5-0209]